MNNYCHKPLKLSLDSNIQHIINQELTKQLKLSMLQVEQQF